MKAIICKSDLTSVLKEMQEYLNKEGNIGGIRLVDESNNQVVLLIDKKDIGQRDAEIWWSGYQSALQG